MASRTRGALNSAWLAVITVPRRPRAASDNALRRAERAVRRRTHEISGHEVKILIEGSAAGE
jgi:hypothetical protein